MSGCGEVTKHVAAPAEGSALKKSVDSYLAVQKDLNADKLSAEDNEALKKVTSDLDGEKYNALRGAASKLAEAKDLAAARVAFQSVSDELIRLLQKTGK